jgi:hypothetical protein
VIVGWIAYRRRAIPVALMLPGDAAVQKPARFKVGGACSVGGGATDRFRISGLPPKVAVLERRSVDRFALISSQPDLVPTVPEYTLGDPVEVRTGPDRSDRVTVRFVRGGGRARRAPAARPAPTRAAPPTGGVDFR